MTFANLKLDVYRRTGYADSPATAVVSRIAAFINEAQQELVQDPAFAPLLRATASLVTTTGMASYGLPPDVTRVRFVRDSAHRRRLVPQTEDWWHWVAPEPTVVTGTPGYYIPLSTQPVASQPSTADKLFVVSTNVGDTTQTVYFEIVRTGGYIETASLSLNGTTAVQLGSYTDVQSVSDWYLSATCLGEVKLLQTSSSGSELARITVGDTRSRYTWLALYPTPNGALTYTIDHEMEASDLVNDTDEPAWLPRRAHRLLAIGARKREYETKNDGRYTAALNEWVQGVNQLKAYVNNPPDETIVPGRLKPGLSDLGAFFPAGTIWD